MDDNQAKEYALKVLGEDTSTYSREVYEHLKERLNTDGYRIPGIRKMLLQGVIMQLCHRFDEELPGFVDQILEEL